MRFALRNKSKLIKAFGEDYYKLLMSSLTAFSNSNREIAAYTVEGGKKVVLHRYDLPREILQRRRWVINWRMAKLTCTDPRAHIYETLSFYDKTSGETYGFNSDLSRLTALKGRITLQENRIKDYIEANKGNLFFDETNDPQLVKVRRKLERARKNVADAEARLRTKVEQKIAGK